MKYWLIGLFALACLCPALAAQSHDEQARRITSKPEYKGYRIGKPPGAKGGDGTSDSGRGDGDGSSYRRGGEAKDPSRRGTGAGPSGRGGGGSSGSGLSLPSWLGGLMQVIVWGLLIVGAAVALFFIVKALLGIKFKRKLKSEKSKRGKKKAGDSETEQAPEEAPIEIDEQVFEDALQHALREYKQAVANEDFAAATLLAYRIFWLRAGWEGCVRQEDVRTWRDALRMVRGSEARQEVRRLLPLVERVRYAEYKPKRSEFEHWSRNLEGIPIQGVLR
jgi:hypothetical protein